MKLVKPSIRQILASKQPKAGKPVFIAIDGRGGSGKSTLAQWLSEKLNAQVVRTDDFSSWDDPLNWWPVMIDRIFLPIANGSKTLSYPRTSWWENHHPEPIVDQPVTPTMILEGVSSLRREFEPFVGLTIFVDTPKDICLLRGVERDTITGKAREELIEMWKGWFDLEDEYFRRDQPKDRADVVVVGTRPFHDQIIID